MKLTFTPVLKFAALLSFSFYVGNGIAQSISTEYEPGTACLDCPKVDFTPDPAYKTLNGNNSNATSYSTSACGLNYVYGSVKLGKRGPIGGVTQPASITISGLPACNTILKAFLYGDASGTGIAVTATVVNPSSISTPFPMTIIGTAPDKCWGYSASYSYRADITSCITGNGTYIVSGLPTNPPTTGNDFDGVTILIVYSDPTQTYTGHLTLADGAHVAAPGLITDVITMAPACANSTYADAFMIVGDLQGIANTPIRFNSTTPNFTFAAASNTWWNVIQGPAAPVTAGQTSATFGAQNSSDCYNIVATGLYYRTTCNTCTLAPGTMSLTAASTPSCTYGTATASPTGGTGPYSYTWSPGSMTTQSITAPAGVYTVTVKDAACNQVTSTVSISVFSTITYTHVTTQPSCLYPPGSASVSVGGGNTASGFTVNWSPTPGTVTPTSNGSIAQGLTVGINTVVVVDASSCVNMYTFAVSGTAATSFSLTGAGVLTCSNPNVALTAVNNTTLANMSYTWMPGSVNSTTYNATAPGVYTVTGMDPVAGSCPATETIAITQNTTAPSVSVNPISQTLTCNGACKTFTATTTSTTNLVGTWYDASGPLVGPSGTPLILCANAPGTYTATFLNTVNGCTTSQTVSVGANISVPTITITPTTSNGFTINCTNPNVAMVINSSGTLAPTGYTWTNLSTSVATTPVTGGYTVSIPGQYEAAFHDGNFCTVTTTVTVYIDTIRPSPFSTTSLPSNSYTLTCNTPSLIATANTNPMLSAGQYSWTTPPNLILSSNTVTVSLVNVTSSTSPTSYTVLAMGANGCVGRAKVNFYKDVYMPPYTAVFTPTAITCSSQSVALSPNNISGTSTPVSYTFTSPPPTQTATTAGVLFSTPGTYTMTYQNAVNGCTAIATNSVPLNVTPPATIALADAIIPCGQLTTTLSAGTTTTSTSYSYTWSGPPLAGMSCPGGVNCNTTTANAPGLYSVTILNTTNGCSSTNSVFIVPGTVNVSFTSNTIEGFAPLDVNFTNTSQLGSISNGTVYTTWIYGNGLTYTASGTSASYSTSGAPNGNTIYQSAGSYTVLLIIQQTTGLPPGPGMPPNACTGTYSMVIHVDLPSELTIPNVFTPNGDGVNDVFFLQSTNLTEITCLIYDRWGVKMYDVTSDKGNIAWDGKNLSNKDVPAGTYFYILKAKGKDLKDYEYKGTISLFR